MKKFYKLSREINIPMQTKFDRTRYNLEIGVEYNDEDCESMTIIDAKEIEELRKTLDTAQRNMVKKELGITKLPHDDFRETNEIEADHKPRRRIHKY